MSAGTYVHGRDAAATTKRVRAGAVLVRILLDSIGLLDYFGQVSMCACTRQTQISGYV
jgi:hypothetical protein